VKDLTEQNENNIDKTIEDIVAWDQKRFIEKNGQMEPSDSPHPSFTFKEIKGDLFSSTDSLAHCVSSEFAMSKGVAVGFRDNFGGVDELLKQNVPLGGVGWLKREERYIYYLVSKSKYWQKPCYEHLWSCLNIMAELIQEHQVKHLSMPVIACGLDKLKWDFVKQMIKKVFEKINISITVYIWEDKK